MFSISAYLTARGIRETGAGRRGRIGLIANGSSDGSWESHGGFRFRHNVVLVTHDAQRRNGNPAKAAKLVSDQTSARERALARASEWKLVALSTTTPNFYHQQC